MPRNGSGQYTLPPVINPVVTQTLITSNWANTTMQDLAAALTQSVSRDGQSAMTGPLNMASFAINNVGNPTNRNGAVNLAYVQDGLHTRLTNVAGTNQITATLFGGSTAFKVGQIVQLIPANTNTGPVTININGTGFAPMLSPAGLPLSGTNMIAGKSYIFMYDGANWIMINSPTAMSFAQGAVSGWDRPAGGAYPDITKTASNTIQVPAGTGRIIAPSTRDQSGVTEVSWQAQSVMLTNIANAWSTTIGIDAGGNVVQLVGNLQSQWARQYIILGTVAHIDGQIDGIVNAPSIFGDVAYEAYDLGVLYNNTIISGGQVIPSANTLHMDVKAGRMWIVGGNADSPNQPNFVDFPDQLNITFYPSSANNTVPGPTQAAPVANYDPAAAGAITPIPVPTTQATIHRLFYMAGQYIWVYGQRLYPDLNTAIQSINTDNTLFQPPGKLKGATLFAYICATGDCTNLNDGVGGRIVAANAVSATAGGGGGSGVSEAPIDGNAYARMNASWWRTIYLDATYNGMLGLNTRADNISFTLNSQAGYNRNLFYQSAGSNRFGASVTNEAETGANAGSNYQINRFADNGAWINSSLIINRASGLITLPDGNVVVGTNTLAAGANLDLNAATSQPKFIHFKTAGGYRWAFGASADAEAGGNVGSNLRIWSYDDTGAALHPCFQIDRATSMVRMQQGQLTVGDDALATQPILSIDAVAGQQRTLGFQTAGKYRWIVNCDPVAETGGNAGSNFTISACSDAGAYIFNALTISRSNGQISLGDGSQNGAIVYAAVPTSWNSFVYVKGPPNGATPNRWNMMVDTDANGSNWKLLRSANGSAWNDCITAARSTGYVTFANGITAQQAAFISPTAETDVIIGYNGSNNNGNYFASTSGGFALCSTNASGGYGASILNWNRAGYWSIIGNFYPNTDNAYLLGANTNRWTQVWAVNGTIQTSDARTKKDIVDNTLGLDFVNSFGVKQYRLIEGQKQVALVEPPEKLDADGNVIPQESVEQITSIPGKRTHIGPLAQDVVAAFQKAGLDPSQMAAWCLTDPADPDSLQHLRPDELIWTLWTAVQELSAQVKVLQAKVAP